MQQNLVLVIESQATFPGGPGLANEIMIQNVDGKFGFLNTLSINLRALTYEIIFVTILDRKFCLNDYTSIIISFVIKIRSLWKHLVPLQLCSGRKLTLEVSSWESIRSSLPEAFFKSSENLLDIPRKLSVVGSFFKVKLLAKILELYLKLTPLENS